MTVDDSWRGVRVALVHDWLTVYAGAEKVLEQMLEVWPDADLFSVVDFVPEEKRAFLKGKRATTTFVQSLPFSKEKYRNYLLVMPLAIEQLDLSGYDLVVSSSHAVAKGVITGPGQVHLCYIHSPIRYAWDLQHQYLAESGLSRGVKGFLARLILHYIRMWDSRTASGVDFFVANSRFVAKRVAKAYRREAMVVYPPVDISKFALRIEKESFYVTASRMVPYKKISLIVEAFSRMPGKKLVVIGDGPEYARIAAIAGPNVELLGYQSSEVLVDYLQRARAFVFAAEEDFGIAPLEAQACGTPVIAYGRGGALETVQEASALKEGTGLFFYRQTVDDICGAIAMFEEGGLRITPQACRANAERFGSHVFRREIASAAQNALAEFR